MGMAGKQVALEGIPESIQRQITLIETLLKTLEEDMRKEPSKWHEQRISKLATSLKVLSQEGRAWAKEAKARVGGMSLQEKREVATTFLLGLSKGDRRKSYKAMVEHEAGQIEGIPLRLEEKD